MQYSPRTARLGRVVTAALLLGLCATGCERSSTVSAADVAASERLVGTWDARFEAVGSALTRESGRLVQVQGLLAFVHRGTGESFGDLQRPSNVGSFDVNFSTLGFDARNSSEAPAAAARVWGSDSVTMLLGNDDVHAAVRMSGSWAGDSLVGSWWVVSSRAVASAGTFVLTKRRER